MNRIFIHGIGAVSPAGWGAMALSAALIKTDPLPVQFLTRPGWQKPLAIRNVPPPPARPAFFAHPRLRRVSDNTLHTVAAALEALGGDALSIQAGALRLGIIVCTMAGNVNYSRRFYEEVLREPALASPLLFPETVFNAPASHLAACLNSTGTSYTLVGDDGVFMQALALAADWLRENRADGVLVVGMEEMDWVVTEALRLFQPQAVHSAGAGAIYLRKEKLPGPGAELAVITDSFLFTSRQNQVAAARKMRAQLPAGRPEELLCLSAQPGSRMATAENTAWSDWPGRTCAPKSVFGEAFTAAAAWQCVAACSAMMGGPASAVNVSVLGANQQAIGARFLACGNPV